MLKNNARLEHSFIFSVNRALTWTQQAKRKQALLESNLPGLTCSTGMVKRDWGKPDLFLFSDHSKSRCLEKLIPTIEL